MQGTRSPRDSRLHRDSPFERRCSYQDPLSTMCLYHLRARSFSSHPPWMARCAQSPIRNVEQREKLRCWWLDAGFGQSTVNHRLPSVQNMYRNHKRAEWLFPHAVMQSFCDQIGGKAHMPSYSKSHAQSKGFINHTPPQAIETSF